MRRVAEEELSRTPRRDEDASNESDGVGAYGIEDDDPNIVVVVVVLGDDEVGCDDDDDDDDGGYDDR